MHVSQNFYRLAFIDDLISTGTNPFPQAWRRARAPLNSSVTALKLRRVCCLGVFKYLFQKQNNDRQFPCSSGCRAIQTERGPKRKMTSLMRYEDRITMILEVRLAIFLFRLRRAITEIIRGALIFIGWKLPKEKVANQVFSAFSRKGLWVKLDAVYRVVAMLNPHNFKISSSFKLFRVFKVFRS